MLTALRSKAQSWVVKLLLFLLVASFTAWGIGDFIRQGGTGDSSVARVGNVEITANQLRQAVDRQVQQVGAVLGGNLEPEQLKQLGIVDRALDGLVRRALYAEYADRLAMAVPLDLLQKRIHADPAFQTPAGKFDQQLFQGLLRSNGLSEAGYVQLLTTDTLNGQIIDGVATGVAAPKTLAEAIYAYRGEKRVARTIIIADSSIVDVGPPDDAALAAYHAENATRYQAPEYRSLTILRLRPEDMVDQIKVSEDDIQAAYEARRDEFDLPEKRQIEQIVLPDEAAAKAAFELLKQGRTFAVVAQESVKRAPIGLGVVNQKQLSQVLGDDLAKATFAVKAGEVTAPSQGPLGWHLVSVLSIEPAKTLTLDDTREQLKRDLAVAEARGSIDQFVKQLEDQLGSGATLTEAAAALDLTAENIDSVDRTGKGPDGKGIAEVTGDDRLLSLAFEAKAGEDSPLTETDGGGYMIVHVDGVTEAATRPLDQVRDLVIADWQGEARRTAANEKAVAIAERIQGGEALDKIAGELGVTPLVSQPVTRDIGDDGANLSAELAGRLFDLEPGQVATGRNSADNGEVVAVLDRIAAADLAAEAASADILRDSIRQAMTSDIYEQFGAALRTELKVSIKRDAIDALY